MVRSNSRNISTLFLVISTLLLCLGCVRPIPRVEFDAVAMGTPTVIVVTPTISPSPTPVPLPVQPTKTPEPAITVIPTPSPIPVAIPTVTPAPPPKLFLEITDPENNIAVSSNCLLYTSPSPRD